MKSKRAPCLRIYTLGEELYCMEEDKKNKHAIKVVPKSTKHAIKVVPKSTKHKIKVVPKSTKHAIKVVPKSTKHAIKVVPKSTKRKTKTKKETIVEHVPEPFAKILYPLMKEWKMLSLIAKIDVMTSTGHRKASGFLVVVLNYHARLYICGKNT